MKKILLAIIMLCSIRSFGQPEKTVQYFGGVYDSTAYFNWVIHNRDTCSFIVEMSYDGGMFEEVFRDSIRPMPFPIWHGVKIPACEDVWFRLTTVTEGYITTFNSELFGMNYYTRREKVCACRVIYADL